MFNVKNLFNKIKFDKRFFTFLFFLFIAVVFWFLNSLGRKYTADISYPVQYKNLPQDKLLVNELPEELILKVNSFGYTILKYKMNAGIKTYEIDFNKDYVNLIPGEDSITYTILTDYIKKDISNVLDAETKVVNIIPQRLIIKLAELKEKKVPVFLNMMIDYERQFRQKGKIKIVPDSVLVSGPSNIINKMECVETEDFKLNNVRNDQELVVKLKSKNKLSYSDDEVNIFIPVEQFTEASVSKHVETINVPDSLRLKTFPNTVKVAFMVSLSDYEEYNKKHFRIIADYKDIQKENNRITVKLVKKPDFIYSVKLQPQRVEYIIEER